MKLHSTRNEIPAPDEVLEAPAHAGHLVVPVRCCREHAGAHEHDRSVSITARSSPFPSPASSESKKKGGERQLGYPFFLVLNVFTSIRLQSMMLIAIQNLFTKALFICVLAS